MGSGHRYEADLECQAEGFAWTLCFGSLRRGLAQFAVLFRGVAPLGVREAEERRSSLAGRRRSRCESTNSASLVTTTRTSRSTESMRCSSVDRFPAERSSVSIALRPADVGHAANRFGHWASTRKFMALSVGGGAFWQAWPHTPRRLANLLVPGLRSRPRLRSASFPIRAVPAASRPDSGGHTRMACRGKSSDPERSE